MFERDKIFEQFTPAVEGLETMPINLGEGIKISGLCKLYATEYEEVDVLRIATERGMLLMKENEKAVNYAKEDRGFDVVMIYNKNDKSLMIAISKIRNKQKRKSGRYKK